MKVDLKRILRSEEDEESKIDKIHDLLLTLNRADIIRKWRERYYNQKLVNRALKEKVEKLEKIIQEKKLEEAKVQRFMERINKVSVEYNESKSLNLE